MKIGMHLSEQKTQCWKIKLTSAPPYGSNWNRLGCAAAGWKKIKSKKINLKIKTKIDMCYALQVIEMELVRLPATQRIVGTENMFFCIVAQNMHQRVKHIMTSGLTHVAMNNWTKWKVFNTRLIAWSRVHGYKEGGFSKPNRASNQSWAGPQYWSWEFDIRQVCDMKW